MTKGFEKEYIPQKIEKKWLKFWMDEELFKGDIDSNKPKFSLVLPPANITGILHMGHALTFTIPDIIVKRKKMMGFNVMWLPGTDHAGIATQIVVERELAKEGIKKEDLGREKFLEKVWEWKEKSEKRILTQLKTLGLSLDWSRYRFTLDEQLSKSVKKVFIKLYEKGLIYKGNYMVNWCPRCKTALSDLEVTYKEEKGKLFYLKYPIKGEKSFLIVATTRPETMLGDTGVAVHPEDERYKNLIGKQIVLPIAGREIPIISDELVEKEFGTGAVKVTPAHDPNDFEMGKRHNLQFIKVIDEDGVMTKEAGKEFEGLKREEARIKIVEYFKTKGLLEKEEDYNHSVGHCQRCGTTVEPLVSNQWFINIKPLAEPAIKAVEEGKIKFIPSNWSKTYFEWMYNIRDWCISRQLWWGHQIPVYYCKECGNIMVKGESPDKCLKCGSTNIYQEQDVLDTWFSSALWPFSTLGWPEETEDLKTFYPTDLMATGFDIIFFWVARMIMMGLEFGKDIPFKEVLINGLIRDEHGQKMSKTKGNVIDPLDMIEKYGSDALRFTLAMNAVPGMDISISESRMKGYKAFGNKLWNAARFVFMNREKIEVEAFKIDTKSLNIEDKWILSLLQKVKKEVNSALEEYKIYKAADNLYHFVWHQFCDWYIEFSKKGLRENNKNTMKVLLLVLKEVLQLLFPFLPFLTEEIWERFSFSKESIVLSEYPQENSSFIDIESEKKMGEIIELISSIRKSRAEAGINPSSYINIIITSTDKNIFSLFTENIENIKFLIRAKGLNIEEKEPKGKFLKGVSHKWLFFISVEGLLDVKKEINRISKEIKKAEAEIISIEGRLKNKKFLDKAPEKIIENTKRKKVEISEKLNKLKITLETFKEI
jgi:valyl-tRNA synthetase